MNSLWFLLAVLLVVPWFTESRIRRSRSRKFCNRLQSVIQPSVPLGIVPASAGRQTGRMKWISIDKFMAVLIQCSDLMVIDLRTEAQSVPFPVPNAFVLAVTPIELVSHLEPLPADRSVVFCGASNFSILTILTSACMRDSAPSHILEGDLGLAEVA